MGEIVCPLIQVKRESTHISADSMALIIGLNPGCMRTSICTALHAAQMVVLLPNISPQTNALASNRAVLRTAWLEAYDLR